MGARAVSESTILISFRACTRDTGELIEGVILIFMKAKGIGFDAPVRSHS